MRRWVCFETSSWPARGRGGRGRVCGCVWVWKHVYIIACMSQNSLVSCYIQSLHPLESFSSICYASYPPPLSRDTHGLHTWVEVLQQYSSLTIRSVAHSKCGCNMLLRPRRGGGGGGWGGGGALVRLSFYIHAPHRTPDLATAVTVHPRLRRVSRIFESAVFSTRSDAK